MNKPVWTPIKIKLGDIIGWEHNPRLSNKAQAQRLIESEKRWGQPMAFAVSPLKDGKVFLYDGHQRFSSWITVYGENYEVDARQSDIFLTEEERLEFVVTMHAAATGSWDWQKLSSFPAPKLIEMGFDNELKKQYDFDANNIKELLNSEQAEPVDAEPQIDRAAELQEKWQTATGQLWKLADHKLLIGDCTVRENVDRLMGGERAMMCFTDPPYNVSYQEVFMKLMLIVIILGSWGCKFQEPVISGTVTNKSKQNGHCKIELDHKKWYDPHEVKAYVDFCYLSVGNELAIYAKP